MRTQLACSLVAVLFWAGCSQEPVKLGSGQLADIFADVPGDDLGEDLGEDLTDSSIAGDVLIVPDTDKNDATDVVGPSCKTPAVCEGWECGPSLAEDFAVPADWQTASATFESDGLL
ncbi:MAG: hypothetical protein ACI9WU_002211, partial [Myxococcota bacterium]